jgi:immunoglobulin-binding protein 1
LLEDLHCNWLYNMAEPPSNLRTLYREAESHRTDLDQFSNTISDSYQETLASAILSYEACLQLASSISLFSPNESLEDISSPDLEYLLLNFRLAQLIEKKTRGERRTNLQDARSKYERFLRLLDSYDILSKLQMPSPQQQRQTQQRGGTRKLHGSRRRKS